MAGSGLFYYDRAGLNIGFGFNISGRLKFDKQGNVINSADVRQQLAQAGLSFTIPQWSYIIDAAITAKDAGLDGKATGLNTQLGNIAITQQQAFNLMDSVYIQIEADLDASFAKRGIVPDASFENSYVRAGYADEFYNTDKGAIPVAAFGKNAAAAFESGNTGLAAYETAFATNKEQSNGTAARRMAEAFGELGGLVTLNGSAITDVDFSHADLTGLAGFAQAVSKYSSSVSGYLNSYATGATNYAEGFDNIVSTVNVAGSGYYIVRSGDTAGSIAAFENVSGFDAAELARVNAALGGNLGTGGLIYVPTGHEVITGTPNNLSGVTLDPSDKTFVYDSANSTAYAVGVDPAGRQSGGLYALDNSGDASIFVAGTWKDVWSSNNGNTTVVALKNSAGDQVGTIAIDKMTGVAVLTGANGSETLNGSGTLFVTRSVTGGDIVGRIGGQSWLVGTDGAISSTTALFSNSGISPSPAWTAILSSLFNTAITDPIVLDLSGNNTGVQLTALADSNAYFDLHDTGFAVHTGWVGSNTGLLVVDNNSNGIVDDITELFGNSSTDGFTALRVLDETNDGILNSSDSGFAALKVWRDLDGDGQTDSGELQLLSGYNITSISLNDTVNSEFVNGNMIGSVATFSYADQTTGQVAEAFFNNSQLESTFTGTYTLNPEVLLLPNLRGYGTVPDLYIAMSMDSTLLAMVQNLSSSTLADAATFYQQVRDIVYRWTGADQIDPTSRGAYINAQDLGALEAIMGQAYVSMHGSSPNSAGQSWRLNDAFNTLLDAMQERLLVQGPLAPLLTGVSYDFDSDSLVGTVNVAELVEAIGENVPSSQPAALEYLANMTRFVNQLAADLGVSQSTYNAALQSYFTAAGQPLSLADVNGLSAFAGTYDDSGNFVFNLDNNGGYIIRGCEGADNVLLCNNGVDLTHNVILDVQTLQTNSATLTANQFNQFEKFQTHPGTTYDGTIFAATAGTYSLVGKNDTTGFNLVAANNDGITLIGDDFAGETLTASLSGDDTLIGGDGDNDTLSAGGSTGNVTLTAGDGNNVTIYMGEGVNTVTGGAGTCTIVVGGGIASGTTIDGGTGSATLQVYNSNISNATISNVQTLKSDGNYVYISASGFAGFSDLIADGYGNQTTLYLTTGGTYDLSSKTVSGRFHLYAASNSGTTLIGNDANGQCLYASSSGDDTLVGGDGDYDTLSAGGSTGDVTITAGDGASTTIYMGEGVNTVTGGAGTCTIVVGGGIASGTTIDGGTGSATLQV
ncbi:MAG: calcium-binding protein, partial [Alphaproteobacteria bacterium]|nr:calcium-binding protein [Alphaproteobacteria bacterium]